MADSSARVSCGEATRLFEHSGDQVLVRPDGYVGAIVSADELDALAAYLASVGLG